MATIRKGETREDFLQRRRDYYQKNIERERARCKKWDSEHRDKRRAYDASHKKEQAEYYRTHKEKALERTKRQRERYPTYSTWSGILKRCGIQKGAHEIELRHYRDRGITVCEEWRKLSVFHEWAISNGWKKGMQIDRIDGTKGYCPENCRVVDCTTNIRNRRTTTKVTVNGETIPLAEAIEKLGNPHHLSYGAIWQRIKRGYDIEKAISTPREDKK